MIVDIINKSNNPLPEYKTIGSVGLDIRANLKGSIFMQPGQRKAIPTGLYVELPDCTELQIRPRSGLALNNGITVINTPGTIDSDYRGEIQVILINLSDNVFEVKNGDRIAQMVLAKVEKINWSSKEVLTKTDRGDGGFGSTGKK
ncbi:MAG: dUTP diphosphatase [Flavobacteriales bacterium]|jgi:dUTP pyrophosphatase|nr:dUTP diphosphatase [Flavobacteriales bacterium]|tara:strand:+ start:863 stop:1297 length:435 start_codon:yes stop_codon:yes gene_type:complete